jgi:hypothetical protein
MLVELHKCDHFHAPSVHLQNPAQDLVEFSLGSHAVLDSHNRAVLVPKNKKKLDIDILVMRRSRYFDKSKFR